MGEELGRVSWGVGGVGAVREGSVWGRGSG